MGNAINFCAENGVASEMKKVLLNDLNILASCKESYKLITLYIMFFNSSWAISAEEENKIDASVESLDYPLYLKLSVLARIYVSFGGFSGNLDIARGYLTKATDYVPSTPKEQLEEKKLGQDKACDQQPQEQSLQREQQLDISIVKKLHKVWL